MTGIVVLAYLLVGVFFGAAVMACGFALGTERERARKPQPVEAPSPICAGCGHGRSFHKDGTGHCGHRHSDSWEGVFVRRDRVFTCPCLAYDGPQPIQPFYAPDITP